MKKTVWSLLSCLLLSVAVGCGAPENTVVIPENPEPLPPGGVKLQVLDEGTPAEMTVGGGTSAQP